MNSQIDSELTPEERRVLTYYADPTQSGMGRAIRLSIQYALGAGVFVALALWDHNALYVLPVYGIFLAFMIVRLLSARKIAGIMPSVIAKFESRIAALESQSDSLA